MIYREYIDNNTLKGTNLAIARSCLRILQYMASSKVG